MVFPKLNDVPINLENKSSSQAYPRKRRKQKDYSDFSVSEPVHCFKMLIDTIKQSYTDNQQAFHILFKSLLVLIYHFFLGFAILHDFEKSKFLIKLTCVVWLIIIYYKVFVPLFMIRVILFTKSINYLTKSFRTKLVCYLLIFGAIVSFLAIDTAQSRHRLMGLSGMGTFILFMFFFSKNPSKINWRPVIWGFFFQFCIGLLVLRSTFGSNIFNGLSVMLIDFLNFSHNGTNFVYGFLSSPSNICEFQPVFAFESIQVVVYFGSIIALLYYMGVIQWVLRKMAWLVQITLGTTAAESLNACACVFLGQCEAPLMIRPYLDRMTASELHAIMTAGFSCIAGSVFAIYINFGVCSSYLLSSTLMSAPGSLACSKLMFPETEESKMISIDDLEIPKTNESNALEAISNGAVMAVNIVVAIVANLIVFLAILALLDSVVGYFGGLVGYTEWSFEFFLGYIFFPLAYLMGVNESISETYCVAKLMGTKTALNEFIAYQRLGLMVKNKELSARSAMIATYALCGFSNFSSIGIQLGILGGLSPTQKPVLSQIVLRALLTGCISCFFTASLAGVIIDVPIECSIKNPTNCLSIAELIKNSK